MNINEQSGGSEVNNEYASQWIDYLKKKNAVLNIVWLVFMCTTVVCAISTFYFFQLSESTAQQASSTLSNLQQFQKKNDVIAGQLKQSQQLNTKLEENIALLSDAKSQLEQQKGDSVSQLDLSGQIVETLKEKVTVLETENVLITAALNKAKSLLGQLEKDNRLSKKSLATKTKAHDKERFKMHKELKNGQVAFKALMSRQKEMQLEMNRLADVVDQQKLELNITKNNAAAERKASELKIYALETEYKDLEASLKLSVEPILMTTKKSEPDTSIVSNIPTENNQATQHSDGLEEIHAPVVKTPKTSNTSATYDYDQISLDN